ncbi:fumarylacetoacetate hydrolase family protein [Rhodococcus sp. (in: high G+C Gram-positive bacteria)]|uniref:fumarylacetoacetate hydrolase family protein n=1 Tax=Rhodococcus sp. TaxID=1831 RepID=UPI00257D105E|nr:fumarylacetoacetate hydrolase family protein [Rhodococcus sp. (in: high G+C Gram-positive bacteria)]MBQ9053042.1 fumarylacetoacetate hydrolase family protein [Rhodococcus sp. (in: high G+C Gram-positive bacteria)]
MRFVVFSEGRLGLVDDDVVIDVTSLVPTPIGPAGPLHRLIETEAIREWSEAQLRGLPRQPLSVVTLCAPLPRPPKVIGAPVNYLDHKAEMSEIHSIEDLGVFLKASSSVIGPNDQVRLPYEDVRTDQEGELTVVIGKTARDVDVDSALDYVFGYTCGLDMTVRSTEDRSTRKSFDTFTPLGPIVVTADELGDPGALDLETRVNGAVRQRTSTKDLIFGVRELVAYTSSVMTLWPGDVILTGTPAGVGPVGDGDVIEVEIEGIGTLSVSVTAASARPYVGRPGRTSRSASTSA